MIPAPIIPLVAPLVIAGMIAMTPVNTVLLQAAKNKVVTIIKKEGYTTGYENGVQVKLPYEEKVTVERPEIAKEKPSIVSRFGQVVWDITAGVTTKVYRWVTKG